VTKFKTLEAESFALPEVHDSPIRLFSSFMCTRSFPNSSRSRLVTAFYFRLFGKSSVRRKDRRIFLEYHLPYGNLRDDVINPRQPCKLW
jgi:hypothetical protein